MSSPKKLCHIRKDEAISVRPFWVLRVEVHELIEEDMRCWCKTHWRTRMAGVGFEGSIGLRDVSLRSFATADHVNEVFSFQFFQKGAFK